MKIQRFTLLLLLLMPALTAYADDAAKQSFGGGISVFVPESLYLHGRGTVAFEQGLGQEFGLGGLVSIPLNLNYLPVDGFRLEHSGLNATSEPTLYGDSLLLSAGLKLHVPAGPVFFEAFGSGVGGWAFSLTPTSSFAQSLSGADDQVALRSYKINKSIGYGWIAGGAIGVKIGKISVDLGGAYRWVIFPVDVQADIDRVNNSTLAATRESLDLKSAAAVLRGIEIGLKGQFEF